MSIPLSVLIVEDSEDDTLLFVRELHLSGYDVAYERVDSPGAMSSALDEKHWDIVISDYSMPQFSGLDALKLLREKRMHVPFILVSGVIGEDTAVAAMKAGAQDYVMKGNLARLSAAVQRELREAEVREARLHMERALRESEERYRQLVELSPDAVLLCRDGTITYVNSAGARLLGAASPEVLVGKALLDVVHPEDRALEPLVGRLADGVQAPIVQARLLRVDDSPVDVEVSAAAMMYHDQPAIQVIARDVTGRRRAEEEIRRQSARAQALAHTATSLNARLDLATVLNTVCAEVVRALGVPAASVRLFDIARSTLALGAVCGLPDGFRDQYRPVPRAAYDQLVEKRGGLFVLLDVHAYSELSNADLYAAYGVRTLASAALVRDGQLVGTLEAYSLGEPRLFGEDELSLLQALADQAAGAIDNARLYTEASRRLARVQALHQIGVATTASLDLRITLNVLLDQVTTHLKVNAADVLLLNLGTQTLDYAAGRGFRFGDIAHSRMRLGEGIAGRSAREQRMIRLADLREEANGLTRADLLEKEELQSYYAVPLIAKGQVKGVLEVFHRAPLEPDAEWMEFLEAVAMQAAIAIDNATLFDELQRSNAELALAYDSTVEGWSRALDLRDHQVDGHARRVADMALGLARSMGLADGELANLRRGALLHDIGNMSIPSRILLKPGPLEPAEWEIVHKHPTFAYEILSSIPFLRPSIDIPYCHHERWDGAGYPRGLKGEQIPLAARIFAVVDVWDTLRSDRPYRAAWTDERVRQHFRTLAGTAFDPQVVLSFL